MRPRPRYPRNPPSLASPGVYYPGYIAYPASHQSEQKYPSYRKDKPGPQSTAHTNKKGATTRNTPQAAYGIHPPTAKEIIIARQCIT